MTENKTSLLCGCLLDVPAKDLPRFLNYPKVDMIEWRLDAFIAGHSLKEAIESLGLLSSTSRHPVLATNRPKREGGAFEGTEDERIDLLERAAQAGAEWIDLEDDVPNDFIDRIKEKGSKVILSHHDFSKTPERALLEMRIEEMARKKPSAIKITTYAGSAEDNLRVLDLIPFAKKRFGIDLIAFCMGPLGTWSRLACLFLGSPWTYVQLPGQSAAAPGQLSAERMRALLEGVRA